MGQGQQLYPTRVTGWDTRLAVSSSFSRLDNYQHYIALNLVADLDPQFPYPSRRGRLNGNFHLHRLDDHYFLASRDLRTHLHVHSQYFTYPGAFQIHRFRDSFPTALTPLSNHGPRRANAAHRAATLSLRAAQMY
jgi:hypothetical protein